MQDKKRNQEKENLRDILVTLLVAFIVIQAYKEESLTAETFTSLIFAMIPTIMLVILFLLGLVIVRKNRIMVRRAEKRQETVPFPQLNWGQALQHDLLTYSVPVVILILPFFTNRTPTLMDFFQAAIAFLVLIYLKLLYWRRV